MPCEVLRVQFYEKFEGYAWAFPRPDHVSVGIGGKADEAPWPNSRRGSRFHAAIGLRSRSVASLQPLASVAIRRWLGGPAAGGAGLGAGGDAAGLVDPVTGEGIYYAMRSGELLGQALLEDLPQLYPERVRNDFGRALATGARLLRLFFHGELLGGGITTRMIQFGARSAKIREIIQDLMEGSQSYLGLIARLHMAMGQTLVETAAGRLREVAARLGV